MLVEERRWMSAEEFNAQLGLCQFLPGPNVINLAVVVGKRYQGLRGAIVAPVGLLAGPLVIALLLALLYDAYGSLPLAQGMLRGIAAVGCGLLLAMAWRMGMAIKDKLLFLPFTVAVVAAIAWLRWPMPWVMVGGSRPIARRPNTIPSSEPMLPPISPRIVASASMSRTMVARRPPMARSIEMTGRRWAMAIVIVV